MIHQIWIGPKPPPLEWMNTWIIKNPKLDYRLWRDFKDLKNQDKYDYFFNKEDYAGAADIARVEILEKYGGIYIDADSICLESIQDEDFIREDFFAVYEYDRRVANGTIGCKAHHPIMQEYIKRISEAEVLEPACYTIGGTLLTSCIDDYGKVKLLPSYTFYPKWKHRGAIKGKIFARQMWYTTKGLGKQETNK